MILRKLVYGVAIILTACSSSQDKPEYLYPEDITHYTVKAGDVRRYVAEVIPSGGTASGDVLNT